MDKISKFSRLAQRSTTVNQVFSSLKIFNYEIFKSKYFRFLARNKNILNLPTYIVECRIILHCEGCQRCNPCYGIRKYCATMKYRIKDAPG